MRKFTFVALLFATSMLRPSVVAADTLTLTSVGKGDWVSLQVGGQTETGFAGEINWLVGGSPLFTYCVDLFDNALSVQQVTVGTTNDLTSLTDQQTTAGAGGRAAWLFNTYSDAIRTSGSNDQAAGLQLAIWQTLYSPGAFSVLSAPSAALGYAATYLTSLGLNSSTAGYLDAAAGRGQDQLFRVPEPLSLIPTGLGFFLLGMVLRRRTRTRVAS